MNSDCPGEEGFECSDAPGADGLCQRCYNRRYYEKNRKTELRARNWHPFDLLPEWYDQAACKNANSDWWFPGVGEGVRNVARAKRICWTQCEVREECLDYAVSTNQKWGIWGGMSERQRRRVRKERAA